MSVDAHAKRHPRNRAPRGHDSQVEDAVGLRRQRENSLGARRARLRRGHAIADPVPDRVVPLVGLLIPAIEGNRNLIHSRLQMGLDFAARSDRVGWVQEFGPNRGCGYGAIVLDGQDRSD